MSTREHYPNGVPCWVETLTDDPDAARRFYSGLFGWTFAGSGERTGDPPDEYLLARLDDADVAGIAPMPDGVEPPPPAWYTHVAVDELAGATERARAAGAEIIAEDRDASPAGRLAVLADPCGAVLCLWEGHARRGAGRVNEPSSWAMSLLATSDPERSEAFYGELFGWRAEVTETVPGLPFWLWRLPGYLGGEPEQPVPRDVVAVMTTSQGAPAGWSLDFRVEDARAAAAVTPGLGGRVISGAADAGSFRRTVLADPRGAAFSASQLMPDG